MLSSHTVGGADRRRQRGWRRAPTETGKAAVAVARTMSDRPNVLLVVLDSVRARDCSTYGHRIETTPFLTEFAREATTYTQARAPSTWSLPSHVSTFTGTSSPAHGVHITRRLRSGHTVWEALAERGYETGVFSSNVYITDHPVGVGDAFETVVGVPESVPDDHRVSGAFDLGAPDGFWYADQFLDWTADREAPWAACVNVMDGHRPYLPHDRFDTWGETDAREVQAEIGRGQFVWKFYGGRYPFWYLSALRTLYAGAIRQADAVARRVIEGLAARDALDDTLVVICSDHGDGLGERSPVPDGPRSIAHTLGTHEHLTHVPLLVRPPGGGDGRRVTDLASLARFPAAVARHVDDDLSAFASAGSLAPGPWADAGRPTAQHTPTAGDWVGRDRPAFVAPGGETLVRRRPIDGPKLRTAREFCGDEYERYVGESAALYRDLPGDAVEKVAYWQDDARRVTVHDAQGRTDAGSADPGVVTSVIEREADREGLWDSRETDEEELPDEVLEHLADIGYR